MQSFPRSIHLTDIYTLNVSWRAIHLRSIWMALHWRDGRNAWGSGVKKINENLRTLFTGNIGSGAEVAEVPDDLCCVGEVAKICDLTSTRHVQAT